MTDLNGKTAIVTGGTRDIGRSISIKLASLGANVVVNYHSSKETGVETLGMIEQAGGKAILVKGDMTQKADVLNIVAAGQEAFGKTIHILVNNAGGIVGRRTLSEIDEAFLNQVMTLNVNSVFLATQAVVPHMEQGGSIVNIASLAGRDGGGAGSAAYAASKGAVMTFTRSMAKELGPQGIRVNALCPGMIDTTFHDKFTPDAARTHVETITPLRRQGHPDEIAEAVAFLATDAGSFITGANLDINGGLGFS